VSIVDGLKKFFLFFNILKTDLKCYGLFV